MDIYIICSLSVQDICRVLRYILYCMPSGFNRYSYSQMKANYKNRGSNYKYQKMDYHRNSYFINIFTAFDCRPITVAAQSKA
jgi:hypothetical protein